MMEKAVRKPGRPPKGDVTQAARLYLRSEEKEKALFEQAAKAAGLSLSDWIRERLTAVAERELRRRPK